MHSISQKYRSVEHFVSPPTQTTPSDTPSKKVAFIPEEPKSTHSNTSDHDPHIEFIPQLPIRKNLKTPPSGQSSNYSRQSLPSSENSASAPYTPYTPYNHLKIPPSGQNSNHSRQSSLNSSQSSAEAYTPYDPKKFTKKELKEGIEILKNKIASLEIQLANKKSKLQIQNNTVDAGTSPIQPQPKSQETGGCQTSPKLILDSVTHTLLKQVNRLNLEIKMLIDSANEENNARLAAEDAQTKAETNHDHLCRKSDVENKILINELKLFELEFKKILDQLSELKEALKTEIEDHKTATLRGNKYKEDLKKAVSTNKKLEEENKALTTKKEQLNQNKIDEQLQELIAENQKLIAENQKLEKRLSMYMKRSIGKSLPKGNALSTDSRSDVEEKNIIKDLKSEIVLLKFENERLNRAIEKFKVQKLKESIRKTGVGLAADQMAIGLN